MEGTNYPELSCRAFVEKLASAAPTPGGGGASALCGALGMALGNMVISLTLGKKKYADVQEEMEALQQKANDLQERLLGLMDEDAAAFTPLSKAYGLPKTTPEELALRERVMEEALGTACGPPMAIMECCAQAMAFLEVIAAKGSVMAVSDAGAGMNLCLCAMESAVLNIYINTASMKDRDHAKRLEGKADGLLAEYRPRAGAVTDAVLAKLRKQ